MYLDIVILIILVLAILDGLKNGLFVEFLSVFGLAINFIVAKYLTPILMEFLKLKSSETSYFLTYIIMFWVVYIVIGIVLHFIKNIMEGLSKGFIIRVLGGVIGAVKGAVLALVIIFIFNFSADIYPSLRKYGEDSKAAETFLKTAPLIEGYIPKVFKEKLDEIKNEKLIDRYMNKIF